jgi:PAS domain S-box-containing protein
LRRASEQANLENEARFRATLDRAPVGVAHCAIDGRFLHVNAKLCEILGMDGATLSMKRLQDLALGGDAPHAWAALGARPQLEYEAPWQRPDAAPAWLKITISAVEADLQRSEYLVAVIEDVTPRKQAEESLQALNAELERRVATRTAELRAANEDLEAFTASVSHDLRAPVRAIEGFTDMLIEESAELLAGPRGNLLMRIRASAARMGQLIDGLLGLSRASRTQLHRVRVDLSVLAHAAIADLRAQALDRHVKVAIHEDMLCDGDPVLLRQVVENLLGNAWKYSACRADAEIEFGMSDANGVREFFVRDNGAGFDMAYAAKLFKPFERLHSESEFPGVGIGLATVHRIVERHGGYIRGESTRGAGAMFRFTV